MRTKRPKITIGDVGKSLVSNYGYGDYLPFQRREYNDGLTMQLEESRNGKVMATIWIEPDGLRGGYAATYIKSPSDIGGLYVRFRNALIKMGIYPLWDETGKRRMVNEYTKRARLDHE